ncbi:hypothetical protein DFS34DRAFT_591015 [Phlyctochytrium arcticum]|nr:hypothetical protein DFS34DRAFT_591381 [Phlyctochytrium arcticum]KAI9103488.1 hypothetical protein DFS34DRAFT_591015 [Phlyctochytrium arcticum]
MNLPIELVLQIESCSDIDTKIKLRNAFKWPPKELKIPLEHRELLESYITKFLQIIWKKVKDYAEVGTNVKEWFARIKLGDVIEIERSVRITVIVHPGWGQPFDSIRIRYTGKHYFAFWNEADNKMSSLIHDDLESEYEDSEDSEYD